jgi:hypothetical protein
MKKAEILGLMGLVLLISGCGGGGSGGSPIIEASPLGSVIGHWGGECLDAFSGALTTETCTAVVNADRTFSVAIQSNRFVLTGRVNTNATVSNGTFTFPDSPAKAVTQGTLHEASGRLIADMHSDSFIFMMTATRREVQQ